MKKVLILSYFFPPCNLTASQRAYGWAKNLYKFGFYPIIITRSWEMPINTPEDVHKKSGTDILIKKEDGYEIHYLPYLPSTRDKIYASKKSSPILNLFQKALSLIELLSPRFFSFFIPYKNIYSYTRSLVQKDKEIKHLIITANPFSMFKFGYLLHNEFNIKWVADYRDDWSTGEIVQPKSLLQKLIAYFDKKNEKKWVGTASLITSISKHYADKISAFTGVTGEVLLNGYLQEDFTALSNQLNSACFTIVYNGTLYKTQPIEEVLESFQAFRNKNSEKSIRLLFAGAGYDPKQKERIIKKAKELNIVQSIEILNRISRTEVLEIQKSSHILLMLSHKNIKGIPSSKIYEYLAINRPIVSYPNDNDIVEETLKHYNLGYICNSKTELTNTLQFLYDNYLSNGIKKIIPNTEYVKGFSREKQTEKLAKILDEI